jgi:hypothetical protein
MRLPFLCAILKVRMSHCQYDHLPHTHVTLQEAVGYSLSVATSVVWQAGRGLYVHGAASAGSLLALYPGVVYSAAHHR